jgi:NADH-quinone oxidoreductase subunit L
MVALAAQAATASGDGGILRAAWIIPVIPFVVALVIGLFGKRLPGKGADLGILSISVVLVLSLAVLWHFVVSGGAVERSWTWAQIGSFRLQIGTFVDGLTAVMLVMVAAVSWAVHVYSVEYMRGDRRFFWFYALLSLFTGSMLTLVIANNLFQLLVGWEGVGICSYLIIGFWFEEKANTDAANKAFITTRIGDVPFLFGIFAMVFAVGTANIPQVLHGADAGAFSHTLLLVGAILLLGGAVGKSAQFPLHVWLPDAMAGPTPASALIHAATMVVAGVYLVARMFPVFVDSQGALTVVAVLASITMLLGAVLALVQDDLKRVLAYSTISQLAYMFAALALGEHGFTAGLFHMFTHAAFKALLFLAAGSVIHAVHTNNMSEMGGLRKSMPLTFAVFLIGTLALMGVFPFAGFWSKDEIIAIAFREQNWWVFASAAVTAALTAFYMTRAVLLTFFGEYRGHGHPHESPAWMIVPMAVLAVPSALIGFLGAPQFLGFNGAFADWVFFREPEAAIFSVPFALFSTALVLVGAGLSYLLYSEYRATDPLASLGGIYTALENRLYIDDAYMRGIVRPVQYSVAALVFWLDRMVIDGAVNGAAALARGFSGVVNRFDGTVIDGAANELGHAAGETGGLLRRLQSGNVQRYAVFLFVGVLALAIIFTTVT